MGKTSSASKNKYNNKAYDRITIVVSKGQKAVLQGHAKLREESLNGFIRRAIDNQIENDRKNT